MVDKANVVSISSEQFESILNDNDIVFVDFWAPWCAPCKQFAPIYERVAGFYPTILFTKINLEEEAAFSEVFQIRSIPHLMVFKKAVAIYSEAGTMPESTLKELAQQALNVDVSDILKQIKEEE